jgi:hypothetical protein
VGAKIHQIEPDYYVFHCPGCGFGHGVTVNGKKNGCNASWGWNGSMDAPTFTPSINCNADDPPHRCHSFVVEGKIQFLGDSFHKLANQTVDLPDWDES